MPFDPWSLDDPRGDTDPAAPSFQASSTELADEAAHQAEADRGALTLTRKPARPSQPPRARPAPRAVDIAALYPKMLSLLREPPPLKPPPEPPVPGSFFPRTPAPEPGAPADLDGLLSTMAEGLLIGETPDGGTELRLTLRDEFFSGTELRMVSARGRLEAELIPPDISTYYTLNAEIDALAERLREKGLAVERLELRRP